MPHFKHSKTGNVVEVSEEFAEQVLRPQGHYEEFTPKPPAPVKKPKVYDTPKDKIKRTH